MIFDVLTSLRNDLFAHRTSNIALLRMRYRCCEVVFRDNMTSPNGHFGRCPKMDMSKHRPLAKRDIRVRTRPVLPYLRKGNNYMREPGVSRGDFRCRPCFPRVVTFGHFPRCDHLATSIFAVLRCAITMVRTPNNTVLARVECPQRCSEIT